MSKRDDDRVIPTPSPKHMPLKFGVMGGAGDDIPAEHVLKAVLLGESIADADCIIITGGESCITTLLAQSESITGKH